MDKNNIIISFAIAIIFACLIYCIYYFTLKYYREEKINTIEEKTNTIDKCSYNPTPNSQPPIINNKIESIIQLPKKKRSI